MEHSKLILKLNIERPNKKTRQIPIILTTEKAPVKEMRLEAESTSTDKSLKILKQHSRTKKSSLGTNAAFQQDPKSATTYSKLGKLFNRLDEERENKSNMELKSTVYPPPEDIYLSKLTVKHECVNFGLNMYFKKYHEFSSSPHQAGGGLNLGSRPPPPVVVTTNGVHWGINGIQTPEKQENLTEYVRANLKNVVYCRYGLDYLRSFPRADDLAMGSYKINLDYLMFQKSKHLAAEDNGNLVGMSFLKTKGQL